MIIGRCQVYQTSANNNWSYARPTPSRSPCLCFSRIINNGSQISPRLNALTDGIRASLSYMEGKVWRYVLEVNSIMYSDLMHHPPTPSFLHRG